MFICRRKKGESIDIQRRRAQWRRVKRKAAYHGAKKYRAAAARSAISPSVAERRIAQAGNQAKRAARNQHQKRRRLVEGMSGMDGMKRLWKWRAGKYRLNEKASSS